jgi:uncharacterized YigZ family protein
MKPSAYWTLRREGRSEQTIQKSRFIGIAFPADSEGQAQEGIARIRREFPDASSLCYGYVCGASGQLQRYEDDHEPVGGLPILDALRKRGLIGCACAVVRYFGGVKLGAGGLARAFGTSAVAAIEQAGPGLAEESLRYEIAFDYSQQGKVEYFILHSPFRLENTTFGQKVTMTVLARAADQAELEARLLDICAGRITLRILERPYSFWDPSRKD